MKWPLLFIVLVSTAAAQVKITPGAERVGIEIDGKPFSDFVVAGSDVAKPFLHPLRAASGTIVTRRYPMEQVEGEVKDHPHHRGLWFSHGDVNGIDFWANEPSTKRKNLGKIVLKSTNGTKSGKTGSISATFGWQDPNGKEILKEDRTMVFYSDPKLRMIDLDIKLTAVEKAKFGDTKEGSFAIRLAMPLDEKHGGKMTNAEGKSGEKEVWGKRSPWVDYAGAIDGEKLGIAIFDHPSNPRHPTYWHSRAYGLFAANIWGLHDFVDKSQDGSMTVEPGQSIRFRYRVVIHPGLTAETDVAGMFKKYAAAK